MADVKNDLKTEEGEAFPAGGGDPKNVEELTVLVQTLLQNMQDKFQVATDEIISRNEMSNRINELERNVVDITTQAGLDASEINK